MKFHMKLHEPVARRAERAASNASLAMRRTTSTMPAALARVARRTAVLPSAFTWPAQPQTVSHAASDAAMHQAISTAFARREARVDDRIGISGPHGRESARSTV
jgi:hypothetical protein